MSGVRRVSVRLLIAAAFAVAAVAAQAQAQPQPQRQPAAASPPPASGPPNALQGFSQNRDQPVHIESTTLVVRDKDKVATFSGDVKVVQGDTTMKCKSLVVFYEQDSEAEAKTANKTKTMQAAQPGPGGQQKIKRLEAHGDVVVLQKDQTATGELGTFDMKANTVTLSGGVMMTQGQNVLRGDRLIVDLTTGVSRVESGKNGQGRVQGLFLPGSAGPPDIKGGTGLPGPAVPQAPAPRPAPPARPF
jgi:lipopolysaccharide export system protein LptA